ncbi:MAG: glycosyltransferase family 4 protein [Campylobacterales bacterium]|nr:glycosyltransferase family 4 protein [Campylobacterales bacterium]
MKNILELCLSPDLGGLELYMVRASHFLHEKVNVVSVINEAGKLEQYYKNSIYKYEKIKRHSPLLSILSAKKLASIIDENKIDVVHLHWTKDIPVAVLAKLFSKQKPKLVQTRNMTMTRFKDDFYHRFLYKNMDWMLPVTYQVQSQLEKFIPNDIRPKVEVLYMGAEAPILIDSQEKIKLKNSYKLGDSFIVGIVGRVEMEKGQYLVIEAIEKLIADNIDAKALIVGHAMDENYLISLKSEIKEKNLHNSIIFTGFTTEAQKLMQLCDCLVLATQRETFGLVLIEAMACGITVVCSDSGGPLEIVDDNETGLIFKTKDSADLYKKIKLLEENVALKNRLAHAGKEKSNAVFDSQKQFTKLQSILENM